MNDWVQMCESKNKTMNKISQHEKRRVASEASERGRKSKKVLRNKTLQKK